ncbi:hypothetical protein KFL_002270080 [Klebsormidium nitens]|uniref:DUF1230 family protein n=1 Tax=Klebsormidium nitens TaxID=105231 RepID=A0A1Y1I2X7_KLENI|nr:hypothetical protein KFL_002270080 [Klebsormidium nitens]|eukprot:GAQ85274.1 hypothetical protein KFL_002270080 [Klebsormidium nitens]
MMSAGGKWNSDNLSFERLEMEVPTEQRPVNEFKALKDATLYNWAQLDLKDYSLRLLLVWSGFFVFLGAPIAAASFEPMKEPLEFFLAGGAGALFASAILVLRMYLGWSYVGDRLLSAVVAYEESGWYDGQLWVKPPEILARDRLLGSYQVKPILNRLKQTLLGAGGALMASAVSLALLLQAGEPTDFMARNREIAAALAAKGLPSIDDVTNPPDLVASDDDLAAAAAAAADGRPAYCRDRYYRALAGGQYCKWEDLQR